MNPNTIYGVYEVYKFAIGGVVSCCLICHYKDPHHLGSQESFFFQISPLFLLFYKKLTKVKLIILRVWKLNK